MTLSTKIKQTLRAKAHKLKPVVLVGHHGLSKNVHAEIDRALTDHELIKIRLPACDAEIKITLVNEICEHHHAEFIQRIGNICTFYRKQSDPQKK